MSENFTHLSTSQFFSLASKESPLEKVCMDISCG